MDSHLVRDVSVIGGPLLQSIYEYIVALDVYLFLAIG